VSLISQIEAVTVTRPKAHWLGHFAARGIPCGPINTYAEAFANPQVHAREMVVETDHPTLGRNRAVGFPVKMSGAPTAAARRAPQLGEHTAEVLRELGLIESL
jgi:crotonobetainyl-CoA:carnitine CoA-transferase CaiB-like acyl-CoA transferase